MWKLWRVRIYARVNSRKAPRSVSAHRSRGGYWGAIWTRCGIQSGLITIFTSSTWYLTIHESQIFPVSIPAFTALKESCKQANLTLFYCNFFNILSYTTYWGLLYIQSFQSRSIWLAKVQWLVYNSFISTVSHNFFTPVFGTWGKNKNSGCNYCGD